MDIPSEAFWMITTLLLIGAIVAVVAFFFYQTGSFKVLDVILAFFRGG